MNSHHVPLRQSVEGAERGMGREGGVDQNERNEEVELKDVFVSFLFPTE